jgi:hypothetical protein
LAEFKKKHGHCNVPSKYLPNPSLGIWVGNVRRRKKLGGRDPELACRLDELGFSWVLRRRAVRRHDWSTMFAALAGFKKQHGHLRVPRDCKHGQLAMWVVEVRRRKRKGLLDRRRVGQLDALGFAWEPLEQHWDEMFSALQRYRAQHGHCRVPRNSAEHPKLAEWVRKQRKLWRRNTLKPTYVERLDKIGFVWTREDPWESKYQALVEYQRTHGHCNVSTLDKEHASLGNWVRTQRGLRRRGELSEERIRRLDLLGFSWLVVKGPLPAKPPAKRMA